MTYIVEYQTWVTKQWVKSTNKGSTIFTDINVAKAFALKQHMESVGGGSALSYRVVGIPEPQPVDTIVAIYGEIR